jgi:hypothetical protein
MGEPSNETDPEAEKKIEEGDLGKDDEGNLGPAPNRGCTDPLCIPIFLVAQVVFIVITVWSFAEGNPKKLYLPRDYQGAYCGVETNWNDGPNTLNMEYMSFTMNVSATTYGIMKQTVCSSVAKSVLIEGSNALLTNYQARQDYLCDCCLIPCGRCNGAENLGGDFTAALDLASTISSKMDDLTDPGKAFNLFSPGGANGNTFSSNALWKEATKYMYTVCLPDCNTNFHTINQTASNELRQYTYTPDPDNDLYYEWKLILDSTDTSSAALTNLRSTIQNSFTFTALPSSVCPYEPAQCIPFPGIEFKQLSSSNYCTIEMAAEVIGALGDAAADALQSFGITDFAESAVEGFGDWAGDFQQVLDTFILTCLCSFVIGIVFLVLLRFFIGFCVWIAIFFVLFIFILAGGIAMVKSYQCANAGFMETGQQSVVAVTALAASEAGTLIGTSSEASEVMTGDGADYRGVQTVTKSGLTCENWDSTSSKMEGFTSTDYPNADLVSNYCRNPYNANDAYKAGTIWCKTVDPHEYWEECLPIGVITPECENGYAVAGQAYRDVLFYVSFVIWALGLIMLIVILCFAGRIQLAISLNKVGALFLSHNPSILLVPLVQAILGVGWVLAWCFAISFLLSQVPDDQVSTNTYATYAEAYGTGSTCAFWESWDPNSDCDKGTPGKCNDVWPAGSVWKDTDCGADPLDPKCFKCYPPRYVLNWRFAVSFFVFLWNIQFNLAMGQMLVAMCVGIWFFIRAEDKWKRFVVPKGIKTTLRYHVGSVIFGSFIVALVQFIRALMYYFEQQAKQQKQKILVLILKCVQCCMYCFEKCVKFINKNAYIQIALLGKNFCKSAKAAFWLISRNFLRFGTVAALGGAVHSIGFFFIMCATVIVGYFMQQAMHEDVSPFVPCVAFTFIGYVVAKLFMAVFGLAVDTSLQCFIATEEMGGDNSFVPPCLDKFVKDQNEEKDG